jgi:poly(hydroxyalkanoate) granule-associated protein
MQAPVTRNHNRQGTTMVKKLKSGPAKTGAKAGGAFGALQGGALANSVKDSAQQIWLAGMGAFAKAQAEGTQAFEKLIKDGISLQKKTQGLAEEKISEVTGKMTAMAGEVTARAGQHWDKLESIFEQRTAKAMARLGVPTGNDLAALNERIEKLAGEVARLAGRPAPAKKATARKAVKKAAPRKAAKKAPRKAPPDAA